MWSESDSKLRILALSGIEKFNKLGILNRVISSLQSPAV